MSEAREVEVVRLGAQGDGVVRTGRGESFVAGALPGERWAVSKDGLPRRLTASRDRATPICRHFGTCGGCMAQHMSDPLYAEWKRSIVVEAFAHRGIAAQVEPLVRVPLASRRRAFLGVEVRGTETAIGFREEGRHDLVDLAECPVLSERIVKALPALREMARLAMPQRTSGRLVVTELDAGLDVAYENGLKPLSADARATLARLAAGAGLVRLVVAGDAVLQQGPARLTLGGVGVEPPPGVFLQAVPAAERMMIDLVLAAVPKKAKRAADLFSGLGTFALPLARRVPVTAYDSDKRAIGALVTAVRQAQGLKPVTAVVRDLFREPLSVREIDAFDCVVFDPPRAGAAEQAERLARSKVPVIIAVSCAPSTLARDARTLIDGGYAMGPVTPIDQFVFSPHVEAVTLFKRH